MLQNPVGMDRLHGPREKAKFYVVLWRPEMTVEKGARNKQRLKHQQKHRAWKETGVEGDWVLLWGQ